MRARHPQFTGRVLGAGILAVVRVPFLDHPQPVAFAHRGGAAHAPENSWAAFEHAIKLGYAYLETDARATSDGKLVAFHDRTLDRVTDATGPINARSYRDLAALRISSTEPIPLIEDLLGAWPDVRFNIDLKDVPGISLLPEVLRRTGAWDRVCVTSFSGRRLRTARGPAGPAGVHGYLTDRDRGRPLQRRAPRRAGRRSGCSPASCRGPACAALRCRERWRPRRSCDGLTHLASTFTCGPSTTGPR